MAERITLLWDFLRESSDAGTRRRRRLAAAGGLTALVAGVLISIGLANVVELLLGLVEAAALLATALVLVHPSRGPSHTAPRSWRAGRAAGRRLSLPLPSGAHVRAASEGAVRLGSSVVTGARARVPRERARRLRAALGASTRAGVAGSTRLGSSAAAAVRTTVPRIAEAGSESVSRLTRRVESTRRQAVRSARAQPEIAMRDLRRLRQALDLNAAGIGLRRAGSPLEAAEQHRAALEILHQLGDERAIALTLNNLALALSRTGDDANAVELFEQSAAILRRLGDEQHEGQVIANLGLAHRRNGRGEEADTVLQLALAKLAPASSAYRTVEATLRRAS